MQDSYDLHRDFSSTTEPITGVKTGLSQGQVALDELSQILNKMGIKSQVFYQEQPDIIYLEIRGSNLGLVIGKHGQTLDALEFILNAIHRRKYENAKQLVLDAQGYREKKRSLLKKILYEAKDEAIRKNDDVALDPMSPSDRKTIHLLGKNITGIKTESHGEGTSRRVIIKIDDDDRTFNENLN